MTVALCLLAMVAALALILRGFEVRVVLLGAALAMGALSGNAGVVFRRAAEALVDPKSTLPLCGAMAFAYVARDAGCIDELVTVLLRPLRKRGAATLLPGSGAVAFLVNTSIPSQTSTLASVGPLSVAALSRLGTGAADAGSTLVLGSSIAGELLNPGSPQVVAAASSGVASATELVVWLLPACAAAFVVALGALTLVLRLRRSGPDAEAKLPEPKETGPGPMPTLRAALPLLPIAFLMAEHPSLPWHATLARLTPVGLEIFTVMLAGTALTIAVAAKDRQRAVGAALDGLGFAFARIVTLIAVASAFAKALEVGGVLGAFVGIASGHPTGSLALAFGLAFVLATISGSGVGPGVALVTALEPKAAELGVHPLALSGVLMFGAEAGRTASPVAAVVLFGSSLVSLPARALSSRLVLPCLAGGIAGGIVCILHART